MLTDQNKLSSTQIFPIDLILYIHVRFIITFYWLEISDKIVSDNSSQHVLDFACIKQFSIELQTFQKISRFFPYHSYSKIGKNLDTLGKFSTYQEKVNIFNWNFV